MFCSCGFSCSIPTMAAMGAWCGATRLEWAQDEAKTESLGWVETKRERQTGREREREIVRERRYRETDREIEREQSRR